MDYENFQKASGKIFLCLEYLIKIDQITQFDAVDQVPSYVKRGMSNIITTSNGNTVGKLVSYLKGERIINRVIVPGDEAWKEMEEILGH